MSADSLALHRLSAFLAPWLKDGIPDLAALNHAAAARGIRTGNGAPLRFVPPRDDGEGYEERAWRSGEVATRADNRHDLFNALIWLAFPRSKAMMNRRHCEALLAARAAGEPMVDRAPARHPTPPPWYFIAKFAAAMMREDTTAAGKALAQLRQLNHTLPVLPIFAAAYESRMGDKAKAQKSWQQAEEMLPILRVNPDIFFERTPLSRPVIARLKQWLGPVLD